MRWLLANPLRTLPPAGLIAVGALVGVAGVPVLKKTARSLAVLTVRGALAVTDMIKDTGGCLKKNWEEMVEEVKTKQVQIEEKDYGKSHLSMVEYVAEPPEGMSIKNLGKVNMVENLTDNQESHETDRKKRTKKQDEKSS